METTRGETIDTEKVFYDPQDMYEFQGSVQTHGIGYYSLFTHRISADDSLTSQSTIQPHNSIVRSYTGDREEGD